MNTNALGMLQSYLTFELCVSSEWSSFLNPQDVYASVRGRRIPTKGCFIAQQRTLAVTTHSQILGVQVAQLGATLNTLMPFQWLLPQHL